MSVENSEVVLPKGWKTKTILEIADDGMFVDGDWGESKDQDPNGSVRLTQLADVGEGEFRNRSDRWMRDDQANKIGVTYLEEGDLLVARMPDPLGRCCLVPKLENPSVTVVDVAILRINTLSAVSKFMMWALNSPDIRLAMEKISSGTTRTRISRKNLGTIEIPFPPIAEQEKIVEILEEQFSHLDAALASVHAVREKAARLRRSLLKAAFTGTLTGHDATIGVPRGWNSTKLGDCVQFSPKIPKEALDESVTVSFVPMAKVMEVTGRVELDETISANDGTRRNLTYFEDGDVIFAKITPCMENGKVARPVGLVNGAAFGSTEFHVLRPSTDIIGEYLRLLLVHDDFRRDAERAMTGAVGQRRVPRKYLELYELALPTIKEQIQIVAILDEQLSRIDATLEVVDEIERKSSALRRSILHAAFTGELTKEWREDANV